MSCNKQQNTVRVSTITLGNHENGSVTGQLKRLTGSTDTLYAKPNAGYQFTGWYDDQDNLLELNNLLTISAWSDTTITPKFEPIVIQHQDFIDKDAVETLVYYLERHGQSYPVQHYSAGNYSTDPKGTGTRTMSDGTQQHMFPVTYGYNYGPVAWDQDGSVIANQIGKGTYDPNNNTTTGTWYRNPSTHEHRDSVSVPELLKVPRDSITFPTVEPYRGWLKKDAPDAQENHIAYYNNALYKAPTAPIDGSEPVQFPLLEYHCATYIYNHYTADITVLKGLENLRVQRYFHYTSTNLGEYHSDLDPMSYWKDIRHIGNYIYYRGPTHDTHTAGANVEAPRLYEPFNYNNKLQQFAFNSGHESKGVRDTDDVNINMSWQSKYRTKPKSGSALHATRYTPLQILSYTRYHTFNDTSMFNVYYKSLRSLRIDTATTINDYSFSDDKYHLNLTDIQLYGNSLKLQNINFVGGSPNLRSWYMYQDSQRIRTLKPLTGKKLFYTYMANNATGLIHDTLYNEPVKLHMNFDSQQILTQDSTRYVNKLNNHGAIVTDT